jgi:hypothetical protein
MKALAKTYEVQMECGAWRFATARTPREAMRRAEEQAQLDFAGSAKAVRVRVYKRTKK